jgi:phosphoglucomutase
MMHHPSTGFAMGDPYIDPLGTPPSPADAATFFETLILSASGWRGVFGQDDDDMTETINPAKAYAVARMALVFADRLLEIFSASTTAGNTGRPPVVAMGMDTRPTGPAIADVMIRVFAARGLDVRYAFMTAAPEMMAWARQAGSLPADNPGYLDAFCYISASHNPPGHNGVKFGLTDGGVLDPAETRQLIARLRDGACSAIDIERMAELTAAPEPTAIAGLYSSAVANKRQAISAYTLFTREVAGLSADLADQESELDALAAAIRAHSRPASELEESDDPMSRGDRNAGFLEEGDRDTEADQPDGDIGIVADFNGSARALSIDGDFLSGLGINLQSVNAAPRHFAHRIVPEGESLDQCRRELAATRRSGRNCLLGYVPDCDGDRGNIVYWDDMDKEAKALEAQETFAVAVLAELASAEHRELVKAAAGQKNTRDSTKGSAGHEGGPGLSQPGKGRAVVGNDATSMRIDHIAKAFGAQVFRAETGEANVVGLARLLREKDFTVRILGEGSNGGVITHPAGVRDPLNTITAMLKLLYLRDQGTVPGPFKLWLQKTGRAEAYRDNFGMADIIASLPPYATTSVFETRAALRISTRNQGALKKAYGRLFREAWPALAAELQPTFGTLSWRVMASQGKEEKPLEGGFDESGTGGIKILLENQDGAVTAFLWMRGSGTEPVFRVMVDVRGGNQAMEQLLLERHTSLVRQADAIA